MNLQNRGSCHSFLQSSTPKGSLLLAGEMELKRYFSHRGILAIHCHLHLIWEVRYFRQGLERLESFPRHFPVSGCSRNCYLWHLYTSKLQTPGAGRSKHQSWGSSDCGRLASLLSLANLLKLSLQMLAWHQFTFLLLDCDPSRAAINHTVLIICQVLVMLLSKLIPKGILMQL